MDTTTQIFLYGLALAVVALSVTVFYLLSLYKGIVEKYSDIKVAEKIKIDMYIDKKLKLVIDALASDTQGKMEGILSLVVRNTKMNLESEINELVKQLKSQLEKEMAGAGSSLKEEISGIGEGARRVVEEELEAYKVKKMAEIDAKVKQMLPDILRSLLGKSLDPSQQEELVMNALEDAKRQNLL